jgi:hypothetical protein
MDRLCFDDLGIGNSFDADGIRKALGSQDLSELAFALRRGKHYDIAEALDITLIPSLIHFIHVGIDNFSIEDGLAARKLHDRPAFDLVDEDFAVQLFGDCLDLAIEYIGLCGPDAVSALLDIYAQALRVDEITKGLPRMLSAVVDLYLAEQLSNFQLGTATGLTVQFLASKTATPSLGAEQRSTVQALCDEIREIVDMLAQEDRDL